MDFKKVSLAFLGAMAAGALFAACDGLDGATLYNACTTDLSCSAGEMCHPTAGVCVQTCDTADTCPSESKTCAAISATNATKVCQCSTPELCQNKDAALTCDNTARVCTSGGTPTDGGTDAGTECTIGTCADGEVCNNGTCATAAACSAEGQSSCAYGQFCENTTTCADVAPAPTCSNFTSTGSPEVNFTSSSTGPVIYSIEQMAGDSSFCGAAAPVGFKARVKAYTQGTWPATVAGLNGFFYVLVDGSEKSAVPLMRPTSGYIVSGKNAEFQLNFCQETGATQVQVGLYFTNGNAVCSTISR
jgi:hypothetical protein